MKLRRALKFLLIAAGLVAALLVSLAPAAAQCAMCRNALSGSPTAARLSQSINIGVFVLLIPPVAIFCGIFIAAYKHRKPHDETTPEERRKNGPR